MPEDAKLTVTISVDLLLPVPEESLESSLTANRPWWTA